MSPVSQASATAVPPSGSVRDLIRQDGLHHLGLSLALAIAMHGRDHAGGTDVAEQSSEAALSVEYRAAFDRWKQVLSQLGAAAWEIELLNEVPVACFPGPPPTAALRLHPLYAVPFIPGDVLAGLASASDGAGANANGGSGAAVATGGDAVFFDALYVPDLAPEGGPLSPVGPDVDQDVASGARSTHPSMPVGLQLMEQSIKVVAARGRFLVAADGPAESIVFLRKRLATELRRRWGAKDPEAPAEEDVKAPDAVSDVAEGEPAPDEAAGDAVGSPDETPSEGPWEWGRRQVVLVPQDGSLHAEGPGGERGVAGRAEAEALLQSLPPDIRDRFGARKRRARLWVTVEPRGNVWRITGLSHRSPEEGDSPE